MPVSRLGLLAWFLAAPLIAAELPPSTPIETAIDHYIDAKLREQSIQPAGQADDATLIRRLTLDLAGRIPTRQETAEFLKSADPAKRQKLVARLLDSPGFARHQATEFDAMLMLGTGKSVRAYLQTAFEEKRRWDQIFRELMLPPSQKAKDVTKGKQLPVGPEEFLRVRVQDLDRLTTEVSVVFFGVNISCAQCHDHPLVQDWKQDHFFGMKSFLARTVETGGFIGERDVGLVKFQTTNGQNKQARMMFLTGKVVDAPGMKELSKEEDKKEREALERTKKEKKPLPAPRFSARQQLVEVALQPEGREFFARSIVNRLWARLLGFGLVNPVDQMHSENPPSHPELLDWLADDTIRHGYDLRRLIQGIVMSKAYSRSSRWTGPDDPPLAKTFAVGRLRPLTPSQFGASLRIAAADPAQFEGIKPDDLARRLENLENAGRGLANLFEYPGEDFQVSVSEALLFSNSDRIQKDLLSEGGDRLLHALKKAKSVDEQVDTAVWAVMSRAPLPHEKTALATYLKQRSDRPIEALRQIVWALMTSSEFRFNY